MANGAEQFGTGFVRGFGRGTAASIRQKKADKRKLERETQLQQLYNEATGIFPEDEPGFVGPPPPEDPNRIGRARGRFFGATGQQPPRVQTAKATGKTPEQLKVLDDLMSAYNVPLDDPLRKTVNILPDDVIAKSVMTNFGKRPQDFTLKDAKRFAKFGLTGGIPAEEFHGLMQSIGRSGVTQTEAFKTITGKKPTGEKVEDQQLWQGINQKVDQGFKNRKDYTAKEWGAIDSQYPTKARKDALFGRKGNAEKLYTYGTRRINDRAISLFPNIRLTGLGSIIKRWKAGTIKNAVQLKFLNENVNKLTGELKDEAIIRAGRAVQKVIEEFEKDTDSKANSADDVLEIFYNAQGIFQEDEALK